MSKTLSWNEPPNSFWNMPLGEGLRNAATAAYCKLSSYTQRLLEVDDLVNAGYIMMVDSSGGLSWHQLYVRLTRHCWSRIQAPDRRYDLGCVYQTQEIDSVRTVREWGFGGATSSGRLFST